MKKGFTLIELLVVIAIIAILAAILFPVFAQAREKARQTACLSNMKQIGTALQLYTDDYDETLPPGAITSGAPAVDSNYPCKKFYSFSWASSAYNGWPYNTAPIETYQTQFGAGGMFTWMDSIFPYVKNTGLYHCPTSPKGPCPDGTEGPCASYSANQFLCASAPAGSSACLSEIKGGEKVFVIDGMINIYNWAPKKPVMNVVVPNQFNVSTNGQYDNAPTRHNGGYNVTFCDGHAKYFKNQAPGPQKMTGTDTYEQWWIRG